MLLEHSRFRTGALVERYPAGLMNWGVIRPHGPASAFQIVYGAIVEDRQIQALLGDPVPVDDVLQSHAREVVARFLKIMRPE